MLLLLCVSYDCACFADKISNIGGLFLVKPKIKLKKSTVSKTNIIRKDIKRPHFRNIATNYLNSCNFKAHSPGLVLQ